MVRMGSRVVEVLINWDAVNSLVRLARILNTLRLAMLTYAAYTYMVTDFTNLFAILKPTWCVDIPMLSLTEKLTRDSGLCLYVGRLSMPSMRLYLPAVSLLSSLPQSLQWYGTPFHHSRSLNERSLCTIGPQ